MKQLLILLVTFLLGNVAAHAQLDLPPVAGNPRATVSEEVGITSITIAYARPDVNKREGKIWGTLIPAGFTNFSFLTNAPTAPWRAGANDNTTVTFEHDVKVDGKDIKAGKYGFHVAYNPDSSILIFNRVNNAWGSFYYEEKDDVLRVKVKPQVLDKSVEWLKYEFSNHTANSCTVSLMWDNLALPFKVTVNTEDIVIATIRDQLKGNMGFNPQIVLQAAQYCFNVNKNLEDAYGWSKRAISGFGGQKTFPTMSNLVTACVKTNRLKEADSLMTEVVLLGNAQQLAGLGRSLITMKQADRALKLMLDNQKKNGDNFNTLGGLMRAYSAKGDFAKAIEFADKAIAQAPNEQQKKATEELKAKLKENKDIN
jgi:hypothetical protein